MDDTELDNMVKNLSDKVKDINIDTAKEGKIFTEKTDIIDDNRALFPKILPIIKNVYFCSIVFIFVSLIYMKPGFIMNKEFKTGKKSISYKKTIISSLVIIAIIYVIFYLYKEGYLIKLVTKQKQPSILDI